MAELCFIKKDSAPNMCGVHGVQLGEHTTSDGSSTEGIGNLTILVCPKTDRVVRDSGDKPSDMSDISD